MKSLNLSQAAIKHRTLVMFFLFLATLAGINAYFNLGRNEDPEFTIKTMVVQAYLPGATIDETMNQLTDRIEKKLQETPSLDYLKSYTLAGQTTIFVQLLTSTEKKDVPDIWYQVRKKIGDMRHEMPAETVGPFFNDEFGDTFGMIYAFTADGFSHRDLKDYAETVRDTLLRVKDVAKVERIGFQDEKVFIDFSTRQMANLGLKPSQIMQALQAQNLLTPAGKVDTGKEQVLLEATGKFASDEDLKNVTFYAGQTRVRLGDIASIRHGLSDPAGPRFRYNGKDAIGLAIAMRKGGDILGLEKNVEREMATLEADRPIGIDAHLVANQPKVVHDAVDEFMEALIEAVAIVLGISFLSLGMRAGAVVALSIPMVLAFVFVGMEIGGIDLQRVSLGALIISLGLLVDDAMITVESMVSKLEEGWNRVRAATFAYTSTAFPMLTGTIVTIIGFVPIGFAKSDAGEYTYSLFAVVGIALLVSWFVAVLAAPLFGVRLLKEAHHRGKVEKESKLRVVFSRVLLKTMRHPRVTIFLTVAAFVAALAALPLVPSQFFPSSIRPELLVNMTLRQGVSVDATDAVSRRMDALLKNDPDIDHWSAYIGRGAVRFYLPLDEQLQNDFFAQTVVVTKDAEARERVRARLQQALDNNFPEIVAGLFALELGPPVGWPVQYRVSGKDPATVRALARQVTEVMASSPHVTKINTDWGEPSRTLRVEVKQDEARRLGLSGASVSQMLYTALSGATATQIRDGIYLIDVVMRAQDSERRTLEDLRTLSLPLPNGGAVPLGTVADVKEAQDYPLIWRRDRLPTLTVQGDVVQGVMPDTVVKELAAKMDTVAQTLPSGYALKIGGTVEESAKSEASVMAVMPVMLLLMLAVLMIQLENIKHLLLVVSVAPLGLIGVVFTLLLTRQPLGFVALLGVVALIGMIVRNSVILVHQIEVERKAGHGDWQAVTNAAIVRFRPIMLTAVAAILGMVPIAPTVFWGPMANAIMGGLAVATVLTLIFLPSLYVVWFDVKEPREEVVP